MVMYMYQNCLIDTLQLPCAEFGNEKKREVRVIASPQTTGEDHMTFVSCTIPPGAVSEGHIHDDFDEYIQFQSEGECQIDEETFLVPAQAVVHARAGHRHECRNTSTDQTLYLSCVFLPPLVPYGPYPDLLERTRTYLSGH